MTEGRVQTPKPTASEVAALRAFLSWGAKQNGFPYGSVSYWIGVYERGEGKGDFR